MSDIIKKISILLEPKFVAANGCSQSDFYIIEDEHLATLTKVIISGLTPGMIAFYPDKGTIIKSGKKTIMRRMSPLLACDGTSAHNRACDAVIIQSVTSNECRVIYIELKSGRASGASEQFRGTKCFIEYLQISLKEFHDIDMRITEPRYIVLCGYKRASMDKKPSTLKMDGKTGITSKYPRIVHVNNGEKITIERLMR